MKHLRALIQSAEYREAYERVSSKYRNQISRKALELMSDPTPGGSRTALRGYNHLFRLRAGDFRIIYAYDPKVVQLMNLRRRDEHTYDHLDDDEIQQFEGFQEITGRKASGHIIPEWKAVVQKWDPPKRKEVEPLPQPITEVMLADLRIPAEYRPVLLDIKSVDDLLDCQGAPVEYIQQVLDCICPKSMAITAQSITPVVVLDDLIDTNAARVCGPIDASDSEKHLQGEVPVDSAGDQHSPPKASGDYQSYGIPAPLVVPFMRKNDPMEPYRGNTSRGISKDNHYSVTADGKVRLIYSIGKDERYLLTTDAHPELVRMVNEAKRSGGNAQGGGRFAINEFRHVLVPSSATSEVLYAGDYTRDLEFRLDQNTLITPVAPSNIHPGDMWPGPHAGIRYKLTAGAMDIRYDIITKSGQSQHKITKRLTAFHAEEALAGLLQMCRAVKPHGGAIYINEARELFAPVDEGGGDYQRRYIGHLGKHPWFPDPA